MMKLAKQFWQFITGYPMTCVERCRFIDRVSGKEVGVYRDRYGRTYLAEGPFATFRVEWKAFD